MKRKHRKKKHWIDELRALVYSRPLVIFRFTEDEWWSIVSARRSVNHFTVARSHLSLEHVRVPTACMIFTVNQDGDDSAFFSLLSGRSAVSTLDTRVTIERAHQISPSTEDALIDLVTDKAFATNLRKRLAEPDSVVRLSPALSAHLIDRLAEINCNRGAMRGLIASRDAPRAYSGNSALQEDAVTMALRTFGISPHDAARLLDMVEGRESALTRINIHEDTVIEHDARYIPSFMLAGSDLSGRAVFENGGERLEVITANKRPLEAALGVDLIYLNAIKQNIVMVQYKILEPDRHHGETDWIYRPDKQLAKEIARMKRFSRARPPGPLEYRINPQVYYLKFVRRDAELGKSAITIPIDHFEILRSDPDCKGPKGAFRISYDTLDGRYLRQQPFLDLIRSGYIGAHAQTTTDLKRLINAILKDNRAVVAAIQSHAEWGIQE